MDGFHYTAQHEEEKVLLVGVQLGSRESAAVVGEHLDELALLCRTAGGTVVDRVVCRMPRPNAGTYIGSGKAAEIAERIVAEGISTIVFDDDLSAAQGRNLEAVFKTKVVDRTQVILDIFAQHARTREGRMQIELAQLEYLLPRLRRMWTHLERQKGGIGMHGPGEKQLELDRRRIEEKIDRYKRELEHVRTRRAEQRRGRSRHGWAMVSLVGYTNAGKSTLINALTGAGVLAYDKLFATLDPTTRQLKLANHQPALMTDTVGFIRKLPHGLVESFKATLEEVVEADLLVHVVDASHPMVEEQIAAVNAVLHEIGCRGKAILPALNKTDLPSATPRLARLADMLPGAVTISARTGAGLTQLCDAIADRLRSRSLRVHLRIPAAEGRALAALRAHGHVHAEVMEEDVAVIVASIPGRLLGVLGPYCVEDPEGPITHETE